MTQISPWVSLNDIKYITPKVKLNPRYFDYSSECAKKSVPKFNIGDKVLVLNLRAGSEWLEGTIVQVKRTCTCYRCHLEAPYKSVVILLPLTVFDKHNDHGLLTLGPFRCLLKVHASENIVW